MAGLTNEMLFYGGLIVAGGSLLGFLFFVFVLQIRRIRLNSKLDEEYGKDRK